MFVFNQGLGDADVFTGTFVLSLFIAGAALALLVFLGVHAFRHAGQGGPRGALWRGVLVLVGALVALTVLDRSNLREHSAERRALDARATELTGRAIAPGSALACLDAMASATVEAACERALFASPEAIAAAVAYVDARLSLVAAGIELVRRDRGYDATVRRWQRTLEADRYGLVAHALAMRGCNAADCEDLKLLRDRRRVLANMKELTFETTVAIHAPAWRSGAIASAVPSLPGLAGRSPAATMGAAPGVPVGSQYDFPSAASIPPVSIMDAEPMTPPAAEPTAPRAAAAPARRAPARESPPTPAAQPGAPLSVVPPTAGPATR